MRFSSGEQLVIPSPIDIHTHLREPGGEDRETIQSGTQAALYGGYQAVFDMPNNPAPHQTWTKDRLDEKLTIAGDSAHTNIGFYAGVDLTDPAFGEIPGMIQKAAGLKLYMDHTTGNTATHGLESVREVVDEWINQATILDETPPILLHARNEIGYETANYIAERGYPVHWCHIASEEEVARARLLTVTYPNVYSGGVTPHHLTMTDRNADFQQGWNGARMQPPLGTEVDADALLHAYNIGDIQILETDHAPHLASDKIKAERENPSGGTEVGCVTCFGISGIEFVLPIMMSLVQRDKVTLERLVDSLYNQPAKTLGLRILSRQKPSSVTKLVVTPNVIEASDIKGGSDNTPYIGWTGWAKVMEVAIDQVPRLQDGSEAGLPPAHRALRVGSHV